MAQALEFIYGNVLEPQNGYSGSSDYIVHDLNGDGRDDVLAFGAVYPGQTGSTRPFRVFLQNADGSFTVANPMADGSDLLTTHPRNYVFADFNGDGKEDIFIAGHGYDEDPFPGEQNHLIFGVGDGSFTDATSNLPGIIDFSHGTAAADVDADGDLDIYIANTYGENLVEPYFLENTGNGHFIRNDAWMPDSVRTGILSGEKYMIADFKDLDGDGSQDLLLGGERVPNRVYWGSGDGHYSDANVLELPAPSSPMQMPHGFIKYDFNNDGRLDILTYGIVEMNQPGTLQLLINATGRGYIDQTSEYFGSSLSIETGVFELTLVDVNGDHHLDILRARDALSASNPNDTVLWLNDGTNHFSSKTLSDFEFTEGFTQLAYKGPEGQYYWLSGIGASSEGGFVNYYKPTSAMDQLLTKASSSYLEGQHDGTYDIARFYNTLTGTHFYTGSEQERDGLRGSGFFIFEGNAFDSSATEETGIAVFRFYNTETNAHFYTADAAERDFVVSAYSNYVYEGTAYFAYSEGGEGRQGLHRFYNSETKAHFYTASDAEQEYVANTYEAYHYEGIAYYVDVA
ncbi:FG-GAP-like repeat-containing protein [Roseibium limicola]|uniref:VCBS repeat-containing protein n=1 Tax=Roseibium limicola TaxID=2816037 RepID=A0A939ERL1_9HYPH|nr:FG-GAP-like repeat-containing protein [Roseibium limicola]MBO0346817.1 VCBS repeat-containing protein [Roseibium limicola]